MNTSTFERLMDFCGYVQTDKKRIALSLVMTQGLSQRAAATATGYSVSQLNQVFTRVRREVARVEKLIGEPLK